MTQLKILTKEENNLPTVTYPNQRMIHINREPLRNDFLGINNDNWKSASRDLRPPALLLYLYLASNADNFTLALSPAAVRQEIGMARSTYHDQFHILVDKGYLVPTHGNTYEFYEKPHAPRDTTRNPMSADGLENPSNNIDISGDAHNVLSKNIEIYNNDFPNNSIYIEKYEPLDAYEGEDEESPWKNFIPREGEFEF